MRGGKLEHSSENNNDKYKLFDFLNWFKKEKMFLSQTMVMNFPVYLSKVVFPFAKG